MKREVGDYIEDIISATGKVDLLPSRFHNVFLQVSHTGHCKKFFRSA